MAKQPLFVSDLNETDKSLKSPQHRLGVRMSQIHEAYPVQKRPIQSAAISAPFVLQYLVPTKQIGIRDFANIPWEAEHT